MGIQDEGLDHFGTWTAVPLPSDLGVLNSSIGAFRQFVLRGRSDTCLSRRLDPCFFLLFTFSSFLFHFFAIPVTPFKSPPPFLP